MAIISRPNATLIPKDITVHLGAPDEPAENITIPFPDYIKNVASSEIYPTWPQSAIRANIYAIITFALNRIFTKWYRNQGYDFDITNQEQYGDQTYIPDRSIYKNLSRDIDEIFTSYVIKRGVFEPAYTPYCDGIEIQCDGLSQWGSVDLAKIGYSPYDILKKYYGNNLDIVTNIPVDANFESYPLYPLKIGNFGQYVSVIQYELNRISKNYPSIPEITDESGIFGITTDAAVKQFQKIFNLDVDGIVGPSTWYQIKYVYESVKGLGENIISRFDVDWEEGDADVFVKLIQYYVRVLGCYYPDIPIIEITGVYGPETTEAVKAIQSKYNLPQTGKVDIQTWAEMDQEYKLILDKIPEGCLKNKTIYPGYLISKGMGDNNVLLLQKYLQKISEYYPQIPKVNLTGVYDDQMEAAVRAVQEFFNVGEVTGLIGSPSWNLISEIYESLPQ